jgi:hypothetical protein
MWVIDVIVQKNEPFLVRKKYLLAPQNIQNCLQELLVFHSEESIPQVRSPPESLKQLGNCAIPRRVNFNKNSPFRI